ncbi:carbohydrate-binding domain-containing protein [Arthrobacter burdickii]|uniref:Carbohydrate-binding domain-containing protein n=1 Tax=Arthrobacter burdickii TaxID=3035920 RepID=A0ABT8JYU8_9MICC|nr:carbohydrate-binding domain-containing protein [Arthrobacter burdickii]MDN4610345.1 carbohydrate-binding domain-containing protein [Arthrobacter burdickii]
MLIVRRSVSSTTLKTSVAALALALSLAGCGTGTPNAGSTTTTQDPATAGATAEAPAADDATAETASDTTDATAVVAADAITEDTHYDADDLTWDAAEEIPVTLADGASSATGDGVTVDGDTVTITAAGTYRLSGSLTDGQVVVAAGEEDVVRVILDGVELASSTGSPFVVTSANEALVYLEEGSTNTLTDADSYADTGTDAPNAALYSTADLTIAGSGALTVNGNANNGIVSKDGLVLAAGDVTVEAVDDGIEGKDYVALLGGTYDVTAGGDGVKSTNADEDGRGWFTVYGGQLVVSSGDDGVKAATILTVDAGTVNVTESVEGMEAQHIAVNGGTVGVTSSDDGVNAAGGSSGTTGGGGGMGGGGMEVGDYTVSVTGGTLTINSEGDGLDSNGDASITGGTVVVNGPTGDGNGALDVNGELTVDGGTVAAAGSAGMAVTPGSSSTQSGVQLTFASSVPAGTAVQIASADGTVVGSFVTTKDTASLIFSSASITDGETYTVYTGGTTTATEGITEGTLDGADELGTVTAGEYTQSQGPGGR